MRSCRTRAGPRVREPGLSPAVLQLAFREALGKAGHLLQAQFPGLLKEAMPRWALRVYQGEGGSHNLVDAGRQGNS